MAAQLGSLAWDSSDFFIVNVLQGVIHTYGLGPVLCFAGLLIVLPVALWASLQTKAADAR